MKENNESNFADKKYIFNRAPIGNKLTFKLLVNKFRYHRINAYHHKVDVMCYQNII